MTTDYRALLAELENAYQRALAALAKLEPEEPTDDEIEEWADACSEAPLEEMDPEVHGWRRCFTAKEFSETIRAALARFGRPTPQPPADGEVAELVEWLQSMRDLAGEHNPDEQRRYTRAAELLEHPTPQPVAVAPLDKLDRLIAFDRDNPPPRPPMNDHLPDATKMVLSPAAQAVDRAIADRIQLLGEIAPSRQVAAAALRAAAGCVPKGKWGGENYATGFSDGIAFGCQFLHELAAELEGANA